MFLIAIFWLFSGQSIHAASKDYSIFFVNDKQNYVAKEAVEEAVHFLEDKLGVLPNLTEISFRRNDSLSLLNRLCSEYQTALNSSRSPVLIFDTTVEGSISEAVKYFSAALALPTISSSFGRIKSWNNLDENEEKFLIHITHPAYLIRNILRNIIWKQGIKDLVVFYDDNFDMSITFESILKKMKVRSKIQNIEKINAANLSTNDFTNYIIFGTLVNIRSILEKADKSSLLDNIHKWYAVTLDGGIFDCNDNYCKNFKLILVNPSNQGFKEEDRRPEYNLGRQFYRDLFITAYMSLDENLYNSWGMQKFITCDQYKASNKPDRLGLNLIDKMKREIKYFEESYDHLILTDSRNFMKFTMQLNLIKIDDKNRLDTIPFGHWNSEYDSEILIEKEDIFQDFLTTNVLKVVVVEQKPFVFLDKSHPTGFNGYCIDMMERIANIININFTVELASDNKFGELDEKGNWNGVVKDLLDRKADIGLGTMRASASRQLVIDFTVPYYEPVGFVLLMKSFRSKPSIIKFIHVLDLGVWVVSLIAFTVSSVLIWVFDKYSPKSYQNDMEKYGLPKENRVFNLKESIWFVLTSMSPEGGGEMPKNMSGRIIAGTWWLFAFLFLTSYTANLSAILTVSLIDNPIRNLHDMSKFSNLKFSTLNGSSAMQYFRSMTHIEECFQKKEYHSRAGYVNKDDMMFHHPSRDKCKRMLKSTPTLDGNTRRHRFVIQGTHQLLSIAKKWEELIFLSNLSEVERSHLSVYTYPIDKKYEILVDKMLDSGIPNTMDEVEARIKASTSPVNGYVFIGDATDCRYMNLISCDFEIIGEEFSSKPYVIGVQQESYLKASLDSAILQLLEQNVLNELKTKWWDRNPNEKKCLEPENQYDGIGMKNLGGIFVTLVIGIGISCIILIFEYNWYKHERNTLVILFQRT